MLNRNRGHTVHAVRPVHARVDTDAQINIVDRGYGSEIATFGRSVHSLLRENDGCLSVGAITTRDYRFKSRPWGQPRGRRHDLHAVRKGCNTRCGSRPSRVGQGRRSSSGDARYNTDVNGNGCATSGGSTTGD